MTVLAEVFPVGFSGYWGLAPGEADIDALAIRNGDVGTTGSIDWTSLPTRAFTAREAGKARVKAGDILLTTSGNCGNVAFVDSEPEVSTLATNFVRVLRVDPERTHPKYAFHYLRTSRFREEIAPFVRGATIKNLSVGAAFGALSMPSPPLVEQRRIAAILDQADALRTKRGRALGHLDALTQSVFHDMFGTGREWLTMPLGSLGVVTTGKTPPTRSEGMFGGSIPFVTPGDLNSGVPVVRTVTEAGAAASRVVRAGATMVCCIGATIGKTDRATARSAFNQQINAIEWGDRIGDQYGLFAVRNLKSTLIARGASTTLPLLPKGQFTQLVIPVPPKELQDEFELRIAAITAARAEGKVAVARSDQLIAATRDRAFRGEL